MIREEYSKVISEAPKPKKGDVTWGYPDEEIEDLALDIQEAAAKAGLAEVNKVLSGVEAAVIDKMKAAAKASKFRSGLGGGITDTDTLMAIRTLMELYRASLDTARPITAIGRLVGSGDNLAIWTGYLGSIDRARYGTNSIPLNQGEIAILLKQNGAAKMKQRLVTYVKREIQSMAKV